MAKEQSNRFFTCNIILFLSSSVFPVRTVRAHHSAPHHRLRYQPAAAPRQREGQPQVVRAHQQLLQPQAARLEQLAVQEHQDQEAQAPVFRFRLILVVRNSAGRLLGELRGDEEVLRRLINVRALTVSFFMCSAVITMQATEFS